MKVAIYCRLSDEDKNKHGDNSESIQNQKSLLTNYAHSKGWQIYDIYCDENYSGIDSERPQYNRMLEDAEASKFDIILCKTQSRFSRNMEHIERYLNGKLQEWGVRFVSIVDNADTDVKYNKKARQINGLINEWYLEDLSDNVKAVLENKHKEGKSTRAFMPYGLKKSPDDKNKIEIDEVVAPIVQRIFKEFLQGMTTSKIAENLNNDGILSPQEYKKASGEKLNLPKKNALGQWTSQAIIRILKNPMYSGDLVHNIYSKPSYKSKHVVKNKSENWCIIPNSHPSIINHTDFKKVSELMVKKGDLTNFQCGQCGHKMNVVNKQSKGKKYCYIKCKNCGLCVNRKFVEQFLNEKTQKIVIENKYAARIYFA